MIGVSNGFSYLQPRQPKRRQALRDGFTLLGDEEKDRNAMNGGGDGR